MTALHGGQWIAGERSRAGGRTFTASDARSGRALDARFTEATSAEIGAAASAAAAAFDALRGRAPRERAALLDAIADRLDERAAQLTTIARAETGLEPGWLEAERRRTVAQTRRFAALVREGSWVDARIDLAAPDRRPLPGPGARTLDVPIGPVAVFGASNFPFAISVAGTDTVAALGAGCPVIVKAHPGHPGTCAALAEVVVDAVRATGAPSGAFSLLQGATPETGAELVRRPELRAVAFTGSLAGGRALFDVASRRPDPIPVYAELGSVNPVFVLPGALAERGESIARGLVASVALRGGQLCTCPGLVLAIDDASYAGFRAEVAAGVRATRPVAMLHAGIRRSYQAGLERLASVAGVERLASSEGEPADDVVTDPAPCVVWSAGADALGASSAAAEEVFGPTTILAHARDAADLERIAEDLAGHLTATIHGTADDLVRHAGLLRILERKVGRLVFDGFPTGVDVGDATHHGGPYPATLDPHWTSIGTAAIRRFARPLSYQGFPDAALPPELRDANPLGIRRLVDGDVTRDPIPPSPGPSDPGRAPAR